MLTPGSFEAVTLGCTCPVIDNGHGRRPPIPPGTDWGGETGGWFMTVGCPIHHPEHLEPDLSPKVVREI